ncbi:membrane protein insertion efficiency factor YidD [Campylobacter sp. faydin G-24]|uniref:Putative membrane protein insertion efficiency factor n=1 Tax=Campylobacter anatolicus TaxID=2829105 RepID=A0ABS5HIR3_9BACT|nr:membrane protein insertion efficiency factor YidD [Campylobacter anatolicus]MBR8462684.1 membrane protein insertion efficiency factor YidD [Campylobacter anatolicus]MBR8464148.1 membrane protein insertion efficiency factor YidD [Campylobacter anatolicus]MBR8466053.1 membrane protein insertion efficiency factor YidD [Campylobacter anatolicus]
MKGLIVGCVRFYQAYISNLFPRSCRYYPTCSEYAIWQFKNNNFFVAFFASFMRILRCNQLFKGGIDYPIVSKEFRSFYIFKQQKFSIDFWFIPCKNSKFYVIKVLDSLKGKY